MIRHAFEVLGPYLKSCHAKDIKLEGTSYARTIAETIPGSGDLDYGEFLIQLSRMPDIPLMLEHLKTQLEYKTAADYIRQVGKKNGLTFG